MANSENFEPDLEILRALLAQNEKPSNIPAPSAAEIERRQVAAMLVQALEEAESNQKNITPVSQRKLATRAYEKLQFDFPRLTVEELRALQEQYLESVEGSGQLPRSLPLTQPMLMNIVEGASVAAASPAPQVKDADGSAPPVSQDSPTQTRELSELQVAYQKLCGVIFVKGTKLLLAASAKAVATMTSKLDVPIPPPPPPSESPTSDSNAFDPSAQAIERLQNLNFSEGDDEENKESGTHQKDRVAVHQPVIDEVMAEVLDSDDDSDWEPLPLESVPPPAFKSQVPSSADKARIDESATSGVAESAEETASRKLRWMCMRVSYDTVCGPGVWEALALSCDVVEVLRLLRTGGYSATAGPGGEMRGLVPVFAALLCDRWSNNPTGPGGVEQTLPQALAALGVNAGSGSSLGGVRGGLTQEERADTALALSLLASLAGRLTPTSGRQRGRTQKAPPSGASSSSSSAVPMVVGARALWFQMHNLMPTLAAFTAALATEGKDRVAEHSWSMEVELVSTLLQFYISQASSMADIGRSLLQVGLFRDLVAVVVGFSSLPALEATRKTLTLALATSPPLAQWIAAVPKFKSNVLESPVFSNGGQHEIYGAVWALFIGYDSNICSASASVSSDSPKGVTQLALLLRDAERGAPSRALKIVQLLQFVSGGPSLKKHLVKGQCIHEALRSLQTALRAHNQGPFEEHKAVEESTNNHQIKDDNSHLVRMVNDKLHIGGELDSLCPGPEDRNVDQVGLFNQSSKDSTTTLKTIRVVKELLEVGDDNAGKGD